MKFIDNNKPKSLNYWLVLCVISIASTAISTVIVFFFNPDDMSRIELFGISFFTIVIEIYFVQKIYEGKEWARTLALIAGVLYIVLLFHDEKASGFEVPMLIEITNWIMFGLYYVGLVLLYRHETNVWFREINGDENE